MQVFRKKYLYNPENAIYESATVQTYNCMNTETKDNKLIIVRHLAEPPFVDPTPGVLQPLETPTMSEPFSVYPLVYCCSEIGRVNEADAMYILKCLLESKMKSPLYCVLSPQGVCTSEVEGLLPNRSPSLFEIAVELLGVPATLVDEADGVVSREALQVCKGIRDGENILALVNSYGWSSPKKEKEKDAAKDDEFWVFRGRRKEEGPFGEEYGLAWLSKFGLARFKFIDLSKDGFEDEFYQDFARKMEFYKNNEEKEVNTISIYKFVKEARGIRIFTEVLNQGTVSEYIQRRKQLGKALTETTAMPMLEDFVKSMQRLREVKGLEAHGSLHSRSLYVHDHRIVIGEPIFVTDRIEKKLRELKTTFDFYAPEMKENIILPENLMKLSFEKMDVWSFGFLAHKIITRDLPAFDANRKPVLAKALLSPGMLDLISRCLSVAPNARPSWQDIDLRELKRAVVVEEVEHQSEEKSVIRLGTSKEKSQKSEKKQLKKEKSRYESIREEEVINLSEKPVKIEEEENVKSEEEEKFLSPIPVELSLRLKRIKLIAKIIIVMVLYLAVFFRDFLGGSLGILLVRKFYGTTSLNLVDMSNNIISTTVIITHQPKFFLLNDISFSDIQNVYNCINNQFDPIYNPNYSLLTYVQSDSFLALLLTGWATCILICATKAISIWKGGISNKPAKGGLKYYVVYGFHELSLAALLFSHFYIYQFFYFASGTPCFSIKTYTGIEPFFDSSLYLFLMNSGDYLSSIFASLGVLAILVLLSACYYAWGPKLDQKYFLSIPSILFRLIPYVLLILVCRIGVFFIFSPSAINDGAEILPAIIQGSSNGFFGIIPEMFVLICVVTELLLELFFYWCERKAAESDKLAGLFNIHRKKLAGDHIEASNAHLNDMSIAKSQMKINDEELFG